MLACVQHAWLILNGYLANELACAPLDSKNDREGISRARLANLELNGYISSSSGPDSISESDASAGLQHVLCAVTGDAGQANSGLKRTEGLRLSVTPCWYRPLL